MLPTWPPPPPPTMFRILPSFLASKVHLPPQSWHVPTMVVDHCRKGSSASSFVLYLRANKQPSREELNACV